LILPLGAMGGDVTTEQFVALPDERHLIQNNLPPLVALCELIDNSIEAVKDSPKRTIAITFSSQKQTQLLAGVSEGECRIVIEDSGKGMTEDGLKQFARVAKSANRQSRQRDSRFAFPNTSEEPFFANFEISKYGQGAKYAIYSLGPQSTVTSKVPKSSHECSVVFDRAVIQVERADIDQWKFEFRKEEVSTKEARQRSFTRVVISGAAGVWTSALCLNHVKRALKHIYYYYVYHASKPVDITVNGVSLASKDIEDVHSRYRELGEYPVVFSLYVPDNDKKVVLATGELRYFKRTDTGLKIPPFESYANLSSSISVAKANLSSQLNLGDIESMDVSPEQSSTMPMSSMKLSQTVYSQFSKQQAGRKQLLPSNAPSARDIHIMESFWQGRLIPEGRFAARSERAKGKIRFITADCSAARLEQVRGCFFFAEDVPVTSDKQRLVIESEILASLLNCRVSKFTMTSDVAVRGGMEPRVFDTLHQWLEFCHDELDEDVVMMNATVNMTKEPYEYVAKEIKWKGVTLTEGEWVQGKEGQRADILGKIVEFRVPTTSDYGIASHAEAYKVIIESYISDTASKTMAISLPRIHAKGLTSKEIAALKEKIRKKQPDAIELIVNQAESLVELPKTLNTDHEAFYLGFKVLDGHKHPVVKEVTLVLEAYDVDAGLHAFAAIECNRPYSSMGVYSMQVEFRKTGRFEVKAYVKQLEDRVNWVQNVKVEASTPTELKARFLGTKVQAVAYNEHLPIIALTLKDAHGNKLQFQNADLSKWPWTKLSCTMSGHSVVWPRDIAISAQMQKSVQIKEVRIKPKSRKGRTLPIPSWEDIHNETFQGLSPEPQDLTIFMADEDVDDSSVATLTTNLPVTFKAGPAVKLQVVLYDAKGDVLHPTGSSGNKAGTYDVSVHSPISMLIRALDEYDNLTLAAPVETASKKGRKSAKCNVSLRGPVLAQPQSESMERITDEAGGGAYSQVLVEALELIRPVAGECYLEVEVPGIKPPLRVQFRFVKLKVATSLRLSTEDPAVSVTHDHHKWFISGPEQTKCALKVSLINDYGAVDPSVTSELSITFLKDKVSKTATIPTKEGCGVFNIQFPSCSLSDSQEEQASRASLSLKFGGIVYTVHIRPLGKPSQLSLRLADEEGSSGVAARLIVAEPFTLEVTLMDSAQNTVLVDEAMLQSLVFSIKDDYHNELQARNISLTRDSRVLLSNILPKHTQAAATYVEVSLEKPFVSSDRIRLTYYSGKPCKVTCSPSEIMFGGAPSSSKKSPKLPFCLELRDKHDNLCVDFNHGSNVRLLAFGKEKAVQKGKAEFEAFSIKKELLALSSQSGSSLPVILALSDPSGAEIQEAFECHVYISELRLTVSCGDLPVEDATIDTTIEGHLPELIASVSRVYANGDSVPLPMADHEIKVEITYPDGVTSEMQATECTGGNGNLSEAFHFMLESRLTSGDACLRFFCKTHQLEVQKNFEIYALDPVGIRVHDEDGFSATFPGSFTLNEELPSLVLGLVDQHGNFVRTPGLLEAPKHLSLRAVSSKGIPLPLYENGSQVDAISGVLQPFCTLTGISLKAEDCVGLKRIKICLAVRETEDTATVPLCEEQFGVALIDKRDADFEEKKKQLAVLEEKKKQNLVALDRARRSLQAKKSELKNVQPNEPPSKPEYDKAQQALDRIEAQIADPVNSNVASTPSDLQSTYRTYKLKRNIEPLNRALGMIFELASCDDPAVAAAISRRIGRNMFALVCETQADVDVIRGASTRLGFKTNALTFLSLDKAPKNERLSLDKKSSPHNPLLVDVFRVSSPNGRLAVNRLEIKDQYHKHALRTSLFYNFLGTMRLFRNEKELLADLKAQPEIQYEMRALDGYYVARTGIQGKETGSRLPLVTFASSKIRLEEVVRAYRAHAEWQNLQSQIENFKREVAMFEDNHNNLEEKIRDLQRGSSSSSSKLPKAPALTEVREVGDSKGKEKETPPRGKRTRDASPRLSHGSDRESTPVSSAQPKRQKHKSHHHQVPKKRGSSDYRS
jgi:hypothetical protein